MTLKQVFEQAKTAYSHVTNGGANQNPYFWLVCLKVQAAEAELAFVKGDEEHFLEELVDAWLVVTDGLTKMGFDAEALIRARLTKNAKKDFAPRNLRYYEDKLAHIQQELSEIEG